MKFGQTLASSRHSDWSYIDYDNLKSLLKQDAPSEDWTEDDESSFVETLDAELEKVYSFQNAKYDTLLQDVSRAETELDEIQSAENVDERQVKTFVLGLDDLTEESKELEKYSRINYTGFIKIVKKHDKLHTDYTVRPLLTVRLQACPFNKENYSPLLYRLSALYAGVRDTASRDSDLDIAKSMPKSLNTFDNIADGKQSKASFKFWVHPDNYMEVKTFILRRLPVLVFTEQDEKDPENTGRHEDPTITQLYFDDQRFKLYLDKLEHKEAARSVFVQWYGNLKSKSTVYFNREITTGDDDADFVSTAFPIKEKYIKDFITGKPVLDKQFKKQRDPEAFEKMVKSMQQEITSDKLEPVMRASYTRTAFQIPGDDSIKVTFDTNVALIREDCLDQERPCRDPENWHRHDIDEQGQVYPYKAINKGEINRLPFGLLEIKLTRKTGQTEPSWIEELSSSHLVKPSPRFSKFAHGVASLFENHVNLLPFWLPDADKDIRRDPKTAYDKNDPESGSSYPPKMVFTPTGKSLESSNLEEASKNAKRNGGKNRASKDGPSSKITRTGQDESMNSAGIEISSSSTNGNRSYGTVNKMRSFGQVLLGSNSNQTDFDVSKLPPGVRKPGRLIKDSGPVKVETKVWLANERTFIKWMHVAFLLTTVSLGLYNGATSTSGRVLGAVYAVISVLMALWGYFIYTKRANMIRARSPEHFDSFLGPIFVCFALMVSLIVNFVWKLHETNGHDQTNYIMFQKVGQKLGL
ncbi:SPX domain protein [Taphrina deformans PYCC 5710]|uniref:SPX domain protein n=1 Tax=Taphrina deformans (strain PYCC 5710 / ATCC 11124 / CBS 356.35 / IMI 108563 / JCM 9778 / NBRC 8474) TaxID=1097556 RepID=R4XB18_TAPDE|nr:SPX domain protein [Taphrina deformans PYCC 5710]|eukprot:CCG82780.1 SPX domain protein [Taphrina deformans PYCC 5710]